MSMAPADRQTDRQTQRSSYKSWDNWDLGQLGLGITGTWDNWDLGLSETGEHSNVSLARCKCKPWGHYKVHKVS